MRHSRIIVAALLLNSIGHLALSFGCPAARPDTNQLHLLHRRTSPTRDGGGTSPPHHPTGLLGDIVTSARKGSASQHDHGQTGLLGDIVHQGTKRPATLPHQSSQTHLSTSAQPKYAKLTESSGTPPTTTKPLLSHPGSAAGKSVEHSTSLGAGDEVGRSRGRPRKNPELPSAPRSKGIRDPWWKRPGGKPGIPPGSSPKYEQRKKYRSNVKFRKAQGAAVPLHEQVSMSGHSPGSKESSHSSEGNVQQ